MSRLEHYSLRFPVRVLRLLMLPALILAFLSGSGWAQFGGREGDVVLYLVNAKGSATFQVVAPGTPNTASGLVTKDPMDGPWIPFGPDFPAEEYVLLHEEPGDSFRFIRQLEDIVIQHNVWLGPAKVLVVEGLDRLLLPDQDPVDLTAGLYAPFPEGVDFGPELPVFQAHSFLWTPSLTAPLIAPAEPGYVGPMVPPGMTGSEYVLELGQFMGIIPWASLKRAFPSAGWQEGIDIKMIEEDVELGSTARLLRIRQGRRTPTFRIPANTHIAVLSGSVILQPSDGMPVQLDRFQYAFVPPNLAITLSNPRRFQFAGGDGRGAATGVGSGQASRVVGRTGEFEALGGSDR
jgi:hypothetical protein